MGQTYDKMPECILEDKVGDVEAALDLYSVPDDVREFAKKTVGETPESRAVMIDELRELVYQRGEIEPLRMDDDYLLRFLRGRNFKLEPAYTLLANYVRFRDANIEYYEGVEPIKLHHIGDEGIVSVVPYREQTGRRIMIYKLGKWNPSTTPIDDLFKATLAILEMGIMEPRAQILGGIALFDMQGLSMQHAWNITPGVVSKVVEIMATSFPMKISAIHVVNESWVFEKIFTMFRPFLSARYMEIVHFHGDDMSSLHQYIEPKYLPEIYGGIRPEYGYHQWFASLTRNPKVVEGMIELGYTVRNDPYDAKEDKEGC